MVSKLPKMTILTHFCVIICNKLLEKLLHKNYLKKVKEKKVTIFRIGPFEPKCVFALKIKVYLKALKHYLETIK